jgi:hypothetical protein
MKTLAMAVTMAAPSATSVIAQFNPFFPYCNYSFSGLSQGSMFSADPLRASPRHSGQRLWRSR